VSFSQSGHQWDQYWSQGNVTSLSTTFRDNYEGAIRLFWEAQFEPLNQGAKILDVGTGNGAVAFIAAEVAQRKGISFEVTAIDLATIDPEGAVGDRPELARLMDSITFMGQVSIAETPFAEDYFDLIAGQFALEYSPVPAAVREIARIKRANGRLAFMIHHHDSAIMQTTRDELEQARLVFEQCKLFLRAKSLVKVMGSAQTAAARAALQHKPQVEKKRYLLNQAFTELQQCAQQRADPHFIQTACDYVSRLFRDMIDLPQSEKLAYLQHSAALLKGNLARIEDLSAACFTRADCEEFVRVCTSHGLQGINFASFYNENNYLIGWQVLS